jgi:hypothetical protein
MKQKGTTTVSTAVTTVSEPEIPLACDLSAIAADDRADHIASAGHLLSDIAQERQETPEGYSFRFTAADYAQIVAFVANERLCCPFFHFVLEVTPGQGPIWLHIKGGNAATDFLRAELNLVD